MKDKILITGSSGFIGKNLKEELLKKDFLIEAFNSAQGDIASTKLNFQNISHVFHLAGKSFVPDSWKNPEEFDRVNIEGTKNVLEFCKENGASLTFVSSYVYGIPEKLPISEMHRLHPSNPYAQSKKRAEDFCIYYRSTYKLPVTIIRPFNIYGKHQPEYFLIPEIIKQLNDSSLPEITLQDLKPKRDYLYMDDFISAIIKLFEKKLQGTFNAGSGYSMSVQEIVDIIFKVSDKSKPIKSTEAVRKNEIPDVVADISKLKKETDWEPKISFEEGIKRILEAEKN